MDYACPMIIIFSNQILLVVHIPITYTQCMTLYCTLRTTQTTGEADTHCIVCVQCMAMHSTHLMYKLLMLLPGRNSRIEKKNTLVIEDERPSQIALSTT